MAWLRLTKLLRVFRMTEARLSTPLPGKMIAQHCHL